MITLGICSCGFGLRKKFLEHFARCIQGSLLDCNLTEGISTVGFRLALVLFRKEPARLPLRLVQTAGCPSWQSLRELGFLRCYHCLCLLRHEAPVFAERSFVYFLSVFACHNLECLTPNLQSRDADDHSKVEFATLELLGHGLHLAWFEDANNCPIPPRQLSVIAVPGPATESGTELLA